MNDLRKIVGEKVRVARKAKGLTQVGLAELIGREMGTLSLYERGACLPSYAALQKIAEVLDKPLSYFFEDAEALKDMPQSRLRQQAEAREMLNRLDDDGLKVVLGALRAAVGEG